MTNRPTKEAALLALLLALPLASTVASGAAPAGASSESLRPFAIPQLGTTLHLDADLGRRLRTAGDAIVVPHLLLADGQEVTLELRRFQAVAPDVEARVGARRSERAASAMRAVQHFAGEVVSVPGSLAYLAVGSRGAAATIDLGPGRGRYALRPSAGDRPGLVQGDGRLDRCIGVSAPEVPLCATEDEAGEGGGVAGFGVVPNGAVPTIEVAVDTDWEYFNIFGELTGAAEYVASVYGAVSAIYRRDVDTRVEVVFTRFFDVPEDPYNDADPLYQFRTDWNETMGDVHRDVAHLMTGRRNLPYGGVAWLNATCTDFGYAVVGYMIGSFADPEATDPGNWDINVIAHELGHNVGSQHTHSYGLDHCDTGEVRRGTIMSYCHINSGASANIDLSFHTVCVENMEAFIVSSPCLESDCDGDGVTDAEEIAAGAADVDGDGIPDACQDCDGDGVLDSLAIAQGIAADMDQNGTPDACQQDCNGNGLPDSLDISSGASVDAYGNGVPDECEPDCDGNGISDLTDIQLDMSLDINRDARLDACEDCDGDGTTDFAELAGGRAIYTGGTDGSVRELHPRSSVLVRSVTLAAEVTDLEIGPDGRLWAASGRKVIPIDRPTLTPAAPVVDYSGSSNTARGIAFTASGELLVARTPNGLGRYLLDGTFVSWVGNAPSAVPNPRDVYVRADGRILVTCADGRIRQFNADGSSTTGYDASIHPHDLQGVIESPDAAYVIAASRAQGGLIRFDSVTGAYLGRFDVQASNLLSRASGVTLAGDGEAYLATSSNSSSTLNGYDTGTGYLERTYRSYPADAGLAQSVAVAPTSPTDVDGDLVPDVCQGTGPDLDGNGVVDAGDLAILLGAWGTAGADLDGDGVTGAADLAILLGAWNG